MTAPYPPPPEETAGTLLAGRVAYRQFVTGYRTGIEPVLLAACIQARAEEAVLEAGTGAGAGLLCLAARLPLLRLAGLERDPALAGLAARNLALNSVPNAKIIIGDAEHPPFRRCFHHVMANPPWHEEAASASPDGRRDAAKRARASLPAAWVDGLTACLLPRGSMSLIISAAIVPTWMAALERVSRPRRLAIRSAAGKTRTRWW